MEFFRKLFGKNRNTQKKASAPTEDDRSLELSFPDFLKAYEQELKKYERKYIKILAEPLEGDFLEDPLDLKVSKFLGYPFWPKDMEYPKDDDGHAMILIAQINFAEMPPLEGFPETGLLQLFFSPSNWYMMEAEVFYHPATSLEKPNLTDFSFLTLKHYTESPIEKIHSLGFKETIDLGNTWDFSFNPTFGGKSMDEFEDTLTEEQEKLFYQYFNQAGHKLGGYAGFTQYDPRANERASQQDVQLLQIDMDDHIMFGDCGIAHIFIPKSELENRNFENAYFYWDCA